jgi:hypothetical protein
VRLSRDQKRRRKLASRKPPKSPLTSMGASSLEDLYRPKEIASLAPSFGMECCACYLGERGNGKRVIMVYGKPCSDCLGTMQAICQEGIADSIFCAEDD